MNESNSNARRDVAILLALCIAAAIPACNTMHGAGQDVENAGHEIKKEAHDAGTDDAHDYD